MIHTHLIFKYSLQIYIEETEVETNVHTASGTICPCLNTSICLVFILHLTKQTSLPPSISSAIWSIKFSLSLLHLSLSLNSINSLKPFLTVSLSFGLNTNLWHINTHTLSHLYFVQHINTPSYLSVSLFLIVNFHQFTNSLCLSLSFTPSLYHTHSLYSYLSHP